MMIAAIATTASRRLSLTTTIEAPCAFYDRTMARAKGLDEYRRKRSFGKTPEPQGDSATGEGGRFVIQQHSARRLHWDLRLEREGVLASWALPRGVPPT